MTGSVICKLYYTSESPGGLAQMHVGGPKTPILQVWGWVERIHIAKEFPDGVNISGLETTPGDTWTSFNIYCTGFKVWIRNWGDKANNLWSNESSGWD